MAFVLHFPISLFVLQSFFYFLRGYLFERLQEITGYSLKKHEPVFLKRQNLIFPIAAGSISFAFFLGQIFLQVRFKFPITFRGRGVQRGM